MERAGPAGDPEDRRYSDASRPPRGSRITPDDLPEKIRKRSRSIERAGKTQSLFEDLPTLDELERRYLIHVLQSVSGSRTRAAEVMAIDRRTLYRMAERFGINLKETGE